MHSGRLRHSIALLLLCFVTGPKVFAQAKNEVLKTGLYKTVASSGYRVIDTQFRDTLYLDPSPVCGAADFKDVRPDFDYDGKPVIQIQLSAIATDRFAAVSKAYVGRKIAIIAAGRLLSAPVITSEITGGRLSIAGNFTVEEASDLIKKIRKELPPARVQTREEAEAVYQLTLACNKLDSALIKADTSELKTLLHQQLSLGHSNGLIEDKNTLLQHLASGYLKYNHIEEQGYNETSFAGDAAWVRRQLEVDGLLEGQRFQVKLHILEVWLQDKGQWKLWCRQSTKRQ